MLLPAELRKINRRATRRIEVHVHIGLPPAQPKPSPVLALCPAERQKRRLSWEGRLRWNKLPEGAAVEVQLLGAGAVEKLIRPTSDDTRGLANSA